MLEIVARQKLESLGKTFRVHHWAETWPTWQKALSFTASAWSSRNVLSQMISRREAPEEKKIWNKFWNYCSCSKIWHRITRVWGRARANLFFRRGECSPPFPQHYGPPQAENVWGILEGTLLFDRQNPGVFVLCKEFVFFITYLDLLLVEIVERREVPFYKHSPAVFFENLFFSCRFSRCPT
jgi:hypothetical protein